MSAEASPPRAARRAFVRTVHGVTFTDDYAWLRADNWREVMRAPRRLPREIRAHLNAENDYSKAWLAPLRGLRTKLFREMRGRIKEDDSSVPAPFDGYDYFHRYREGGEHPLVCRRPRGAEGEESVLLDGDALAAGHAYFQLGSTAPSPDHALLAWSADEAGSELDVIRVRELKSGIDRPDAVKEATGSVVWRADGSGFYYVRYDEEHRPRSVYLHRLGTEQGADRLVYHEEDPGFFVGIGRSQSRRFLVIDAHDHQTSEVRILDLAGGEAEPRLVAAREVGVEYDIDHHGEQLVIRTNADGAEDFKLVAAPLATPGRAHWRDLVAHRAGRTILSHATLARYLVWLEREDGLPRITARELATGADHAISFPEEAYSLSLSTGYEFDTDAIRFVYSSPTTPAETWDYDLATRERTFRKRQEIPSGHEPADYVARRLMAPASDGELVPVTVLMRKGTPLDGSAPLYLYGYGAYGHAMPANFRTSPLSLVDRGMVFALAHVRGGSDKGRGWYKAGKLDRKPNTFTDFIAAAEHLVKLGYADGTRIIAHGGSAGGMLMGAIANLRPDLFKGIVAEVPFVDVLNTMLDDTLPLTPPEWPEWGNPIADPEAFARIRAYSPYDQVAAKAYPAILAIGGLTDPRVTYWEPAKWVARLREHATSPAPILLHTYMSAGHGGSAGRLEHLKETAMIYAFALHIAGLADAKPVKAKR